MTHLCPCPPKCGDDYTLQKNHNVTFGDQPLLLYSGIKCNFHLAAVLPERLIILERNIMIAEKARKRKKNAFFQWVAVDFFPRFLLTNFRVFQTNLPKDLQLCTLKKKRLEMKLCFQMST